VVIDVGPSFQTQRQESFAALTDLASKSPELMNVAGDIIMRAADFPMANELADRIEKTLPPNLQPQKQGGKEAQAAQLAQQAQQMQQQLQQMQMQLQDAQLELQKKEAEIDKLTAEAEKLRADAQQSIANGEARLADVESRTQEREINTALAIDERTEQ